jgi:hypothetical protein
VVHSMELVGAFEIKALAGNLWLLYENKFTRVQKRPSQIADDKIFFQFSFHLCHL